MLHISYHFSTLNIWYLHLLVYYKYMLNFQWGLFCRLRFGVTFSSFCISNLTWTSSSHDLFVLIQGILEQISDIFTNFSHVITAQLYVSQKKFNSLYVDYHNLNIKCIETNIFYNGFYRHGKKFHLYEHGYQAKL